MSGKREIEIENCDLEETDEDLKSFLQGEAGLGNSEISKICADSCTDPDTCSSCFDVNEKMNEIEFWHQEHPQQSLFDPQSNKCAIVQNEFQSCAAVYNVKRQEDIKTGKNFWRYPIRKSSARSFKILIFPIFLSRCSVTLRHGYPIKSGQTASPFPSR